MKKLFLCLMLLLALLLPVAALAEGELPTEPFTWQYLVTILGATAATVVIVQVFKLPLDKIWKIPTRIVVYFIALIILELATYFTTGLDASSAILAVFNAFLVALAAYGSYELTFRYSDEKKKQE
jgi:energy-coupling factor transporter transmembrane protein EcfT